VHYVSPTEDNHKQAKAMKNLGIYTHVNTEIGDIIVANINHKLIEDLINPDDQTTLNNLIAKKPLTKKKKAVKVKN